MKALRFELKGETAFFKTQEVNTYCYFTYGQIHKPALLGMFGAIMGYKGYGFEYKDYPEYYEKLKQLKVSVIPLGNKGCFDRKVQTFNNTVGYASYEQGGNLIVKEQWIENPDWIIYVQINDKESEKLAEKICAKECVYIPYLGKNDHPADIIDTEIIEIEETKAEGKRIDSLTPYGAADYEGTASYKYETFLPVSLAKSTNLYELEKFVFTDDIAEECNCLYLAEGKNIIFY